MSDQNKQWVRLGNLPAGLIFTTQDGILAVKSEYYYPHASCKCILLGSGEYAHFPDGDDTLVSAVEMPQSAPSQRAAVRFIRVEFESDSGFDPELLKTLEKIWAS